MLVEFVMEWVGWRISWFKSSVGGSVLRSLCHGSCVVEQMLFLA